MFWKICAACVGLFVIVGGWIGFNAARTFLGYNVKSTDYTKDWTRFNATYFDHFFDVPKEATIVHARLVEDCCFITATATFRLPNTRLPEEWLKQMAKAANVPKKPTGSFLYETPEQESPSKSLSYDPLTKTYTAELFG